jgi:DNA-binding NarL/FixJ family response regulator
MVSKRKRVKVLIVEDYILSRKGLRLMIEELSGYNVVAEAGEAEEGLKLARTHRPDLAIVDVGLPTMNGLEYSRRLLKMLPRVQIILLSVHGDKEIVQAAVRMGIAGYVLKDDAGSLHEAMRAIMKGKRYLSPSLSNVITDIIISTGTPVLDSQKLEKLSLREMQVLSMTVAGETKTTIAKRLHISPNTVKTHRVRIKDKLKLKSFSEIRESVLSKYIHSGQ